MVTVPPAIFFHPDAVETDGKDLVGRRSAGEGFLRGWLKHAPGERVVAVCQTEAGSKAFRSRAAELGETRPIETLTLRGGDFAAAGTIFFPGPGFMNAPWLRQRRGGQSCSLVGITHTVSTRRVMEGLHRIVSEPVEDWDAIICTSRAVRSVVRRQFELEEEFFRQRFGAARVPLPQLPLIPLGIDAAAFRRSASVRAGMRQRFGAPDEALVILTMGRLTSVEKANMVPLFQVLETLAGRLDRPVHLWMAGWASREDERKLHERGAAEIAPKVTAQLIDGRAPELRAGIWSGADIFTLPVDNIQETFGLVPLEAMAAELPVVMPDWDGFRDTVVHGETGFLVPTRMPPAGLGAALARRYADGTDDYLRYLAMVQQETAIDLHAYLAAFEALADPELRRRMGAAGRVHVASRFDWSAVVPQYIALAEDLAQWRAAAVATTMRLASGPLNPLEIDPFDLYADYPTRPLVPADLVRPGVAIDTVRLAQLDTVNGRALYKRKLLPDAALLALQAAVPEAGTTVGEIAAQTRQSLPQAMAGLLFLAKHGAVTLPDCAPRS